MRCPKCGCEAGNQSVCPFCGGTIYVSAPTWQAGRATVPSGREAAPVRRQDPDRRHSRLETKINMLLVLQCGTFALMLLVLISLVLK